MNRYNRNRCFLIRRVLIFFLTVFISACGKADSDVMNLHESLHPSPMSAKPAGGIPEKAAETYTGEKEEPEFEIDDYFDSDTFKYHYVYDNDYLYILLDYEDISLEEILSAVDQNSLIPDEFKPLVKQYCTDFVTRQPDAECRILYENLKTLKISCLDRNSLAVATLSNHSAGGYDRNKNTISVLDSLDFTKGAWGYQVMYHELSHAARTGVWDIDMIKRRAECEGPNFNTITSAEALNSLFAVSLLDYEEDEIAYQLQSNYFKIMIDSMGNYQLSDYMNRSLSYFVYKLGEYNDGDVWKAAGIIRLIDEQYNDLYRGRAEKSQKKYYPIYDYISCMYYKNRITADMTYEEACKVADNLVYQIIRNVETDYYIDVEHIYCYFKEYYDQLNS